uniref:Carboxylic ester hydrolase n=1 Tax=Propylea japonica TaxID=158624 RepID=A0A5J6XW77_9CUCU|nr:caryl carboxylesterase [Propylea japonica]QKI86658.1 glutathione S-transferase [Propylea japonica]
MHIFLLLLCMLASTSLTYRVEMDPTTRTTNGKVVGVNMISRKGRKFAAFRGIPYAMPPVGNLRFQEPKEPEKWSHTFFATKDPPKCAQKNYLFGDQMVEGSEDCLYINVYTPEFQPQRSRTKLLPVMVFIHWGGFFTGTSRTDYHGPEYLMDKDVVLVTFNYRLGLLGFFSTYDDASPGNFGLKDQNLALRWVQKNIRYFGGNKSEVTIFGQSAGGASVHYHMLSRSSRGLFQRAISESGNALALWAQPIPGIGSKLLPVQASLVGCGEYILNSSDLVDCMRKVSVETLLQSGDNFKFFSVDPLSVYQPVIEKKTHRNPNPFITRHPLDYIKNGHFQKVPWIVGLASDDGLVRTSGLWSQPEVWKALNSRFDELMPKLMLLEISVPKNEVESTWEKIREFYFPNLGRRNSSEHDIMRGLTDLYSDRAFHYSTYQAVQLHSKMGHEQIRFFNFDYRGEYSYKTVFSGVNDTRSNYSYNSSHCDELIYLFKSNAFFPSLTNPNDQKMIDIMVEMWTNFAIHGDPTYNTNIPKWYPIYNKEKHDGSMKNISYLDISGTYSDARSQSLQMKTGVYNDRLRFWENLSLFENIEILGEKQQKLQR